MCNYGEAHHTEGFVTLDLTPNSANGTKVVSKPPRPKKEKKRKAPPSSQRRQTHLRRRCVAGEDDTSPAEGGKVRVRFVDAAASECWYNGIIIHVCELTNDEGPESSQEAPKHRLKIKYDDGVEEETIYPDADIKLVK
jgi:hypothetical protein